MQGMIQKSIMDTCSDMPALFNFNCQPMLKNSEKIETYCRYDDDEICTDLEFCSMKQLNVPQEPYVESSASVVMRNDENKHFFFMKTTMKIKNTTVI